MADDSDESLEVETPSDGGRDAAPARDAGAIEAEGATPPGYDWPTHGGYLGCLLAVMFACLLAPLGYIVVGFLGALLWPALGNLGVGIAIALTVIGYVALFIGLARMGWGLGKRFLREYPQPARPVWGEDDEEPATEAEPATDAGAHDAGLTGEPSGEPAETP